MSSEFRIATLHWLVADEEGFESELGAGDGRPAPRVGDTVRLVDEDQTVSHYVLINSFMRGWYEGVVIGTFPWGEGVVSHDEFGLKQQRDGKIVQFKLEHVFAHTLSHHG